MSSRFERVSARREFEGSFFTVCTGAFRHEDGKEVEREWVEHDGAVGIVAHDGESLYLVRQPREAVGSPDLLEVPAGKLDVEGEEPLETAKRELAEEIGKTAEHWEELTWAWASPGFSDERFQIYLATGLRDAEGEHEADENERIEIVRWPLDRLREAIDTVTDSKTLIGLLLLERRRS